MYLSPISRLALLLDKVGYAIIEVVYFTPITGLGQLSKLV